jgi:hypothetical protein
VIDSKPWLKKALQVLANCKTPSAAVAIILQMEYALNDGRPVTLANKTLLEWGVRRNTKTRTLETLEKTGLITVQHRPGKSPIVTILPPP